MISVMSNDKDLHEIAILFKKIALPCAQKAKKEEEKSWRLTDSTGLLLYAIEEGWRQKLRQNVVVLEWGARSNAALGILV